MKINEFNFNLVAEEVNDLKDNNNTLIFNFTNSTSEDEWSYGIKIIEVLDCELIAYGTIGAYIKTFNLYEFEDDIEEFLEIIENDIKEQIEDMNKFYNSDTVTIKHN